MLTALIEGSSPRTDDHRVMEALKTAGMDVFSGRGRNDSRIGLLGPDGRVYRLFQTFSAEENAMVGRVLQEMGLERRTFPDARFDSVWG